MDIENEKVDIQERKVDIESVLSKKGSDFSVKTTVYIHRLFEKFGFDEVFGRTAVRDKLPHGFNNRLRRSVQGRSVRYYPRGHL